MTQFFTAAHGPRLAYADQGAGLPVLCLAGQTRTMADFDYLAPHLPGIRLIRMDYRGRGQSQWTGAETYTVPQEGQDALALLDHLGIAQAAILGTSRGGLIGRLGLCHPRVPAHRRQEGLGGASRFVRARGNPPYNFFVYQWDLWLLFYMFSVVALANRGADGRLTSVDQSTVKRIVSMELTEPKGLFEGGTIDPSLGMQAPVPTAAVPGMVPTDPTFGLTARGMGEWNTFYDLRNSAMTCIVASQRLPDFLSAIERTNFMTVASIDVSEVNAWEELKHSIQCVLRFIESGADRCHGDKRWSA